MDEEKEMKSKKQVVVYEVLAIALVIIGFLCLLIPVFSDDMEMTWIPIVLFFVFDLSGLFVLIKIYPDAIGHEAGSYYDKIEKIQLTCLQSTTSQSMLNTFIENGFKSTPVGFYRKKILSLSKDSVCYYVAHVNVVEIEKSIEWICDRYDTLDEKTNAVAIIMLLNMQEPTKEDFDKAKNLAVNQMVEEKVMPSATGISLVPVIIDSSSSCAYYLAGGPRISIYRHASRLLQKYFQ